MPATTITPERSFGKLRVITNYFRSTNNQVHTSDLNLLSIKYKLQSDLKFDILMILLIQKHNILYN